ncbi:hypothetical protein [Bacillus sp. JCM 19034]
MTVQLISGVSVVFTQNDVLSIGLLHALVISVLFAVLSYLVMILLRKH